MRPPMSLIVSMTVIIVTVRFLGGGAAILAAECHVHQPEHIKGGDKSGNHADQPVNPACVEGPPKDLVFGPEARQRRNTGDGEGANPHRDESPWHVNAQPAHL